MISAELVISKFRLQVRALSHTVPGMRDSFLMKRTSWLAIVFVIAGAGTAYPRDGRPEFVDDLLHVESEWVFGASVGPADQKITMRNAFHTRISKPTKIVLEQPGSMLVTVRMQTHRELSYWGSPSLATAKTKAEALKSISAALK